MRVRLKYLLPLAQMALAAALLRWAFLSDNALKGVVDMLGPNPAFTLFVSINAPVATLAQRLWNRDMPADFGLVAAVGIFWYWIALNIDSWNERRTLVLFAWTPMRVGADLLLIAIGGLLGGVLIENGLDLVNRNRGLPATVVQGWMWSWFIPNWALLLVWSLGLVVLCGRDLIQCVRRESPKN
jgi:hypothetical protein